MKQLVIAVAFCVAVSSARADLTIVQKVEGASGGSQEMTLKFKGDKMRLDMSPQVTTIVDTKTGEMINLMHDQKSIMRMSGEKMKAAMEMAQQFGGKKQTAEKPKLVATGKKEMVNGYEAAEYTYETPQFKATYWIAPKYPNSAEALKQLQAINPDIWKGGNNQMPDYRDFPGLPIKTVVNFSGSQIISTLSSINQNPLNDGDFVPPKDYQEMKMPDLSSLLQKSAPPASSASAHP